MEEFEKLAKDVHFERIRSEKLSYKINKENGNVIYVDFCCWCNGKENVSRTNENDFKTFLEQENIKLNNFQKMYLAQKYFNYIFEYNETTKKWKSFKNDLN